MIDLFEGPLSPPNMVVPAMLQHVENKQMIHPPNDIASILDNHPPRPIRLLNTHSGTADQL